MLISHTWTLKEENVNNS